MSVGNIFIITAIVFLVSIAALAIVMTEKFNNDEKNGNNKK
jgi:multisubunit Na+/H+ antiporter MnhC subunit